MSNVNQLNQNYYMKYGTLGVPDLLATAKPIQEALRLEMESVILTDPIRVLELGFGSRFDRYEHIFFVSNRKWEVTLSDFDTKILPNDDRVTTEKFDLLNDSFPSGIFDVILSTYTFDSITFPEDTAHYPGGLIKIAREAITHLSSGGFFLTIDKNSLAAMDEFQPAGGAVFKTLNLESARIALNGQLESLDDFLERHHQSLPFTLSDHGCLFARK